MNNHETTQVYRAESMFEAWISAVTPDSPTVNCLDDTYQPEAEVKFTDAAAVQAYVDKVLAHLRGNGCNYGGREQTDVLVRARQGETKAIYDAATASIAIPSREVGTKSGWALREAVVLHEVAHHLCGRDDHDRTFRNTLVRLWEDIGSRVNAHLLAGAYAEEGLSGELPEDHNEKSLDKIAKLLRQAEGATTQAEREAFMERAQTLATKNSIALAIARQHTAKREAREEPVFRATRLGRPGQRGLKKYVALFQRICWVNDVRLTVRADSTGCTAFGFPSDIDVVEALFASLMVQMVDACEAWLATEEYRDEEVWSERQWRYIPMPKISARLSFYDAYSDRIYERLQHAKDTAIAEAQAAETGHTDRAPVSTTLALRAKEKAVTAFYDEQIVALGVRGVWQGTTRDALRSDDAYFAGRLAADRANLSGENRRAIS